MKPLFGAIALMFMLFLTEIETVGKKLKQTETRPIACRGPEFKPDKIIDPTGESAHKLFLKHYEQKGFPNASEVTLELYSERHAGGSYHLPEEKFNRDSIQIYDLTRKRLREPFLQEHHQKMYQQHQDFQDHSGGPESNSRGKVKVENTQNSVVHRYPEGGPPNIPAATFELNTQRSRGTKHRSQNVGNESGGSGSGSGYNHPHTAPPMSPSKDMYPQFYIPPPEDLDF